MNFEPEEAAYRAARNTTAGFRDLYASGSGFSNYFPRPSYQNKASLNCTKCMWDIH
jgi:tripeptidyl-peptidase-1